MSYTLELFIDQKGDIIRRDELERLAQAASEWVTAFADYIQREVLPVFEAAAKMFQEFAQSICAPYQAALAQMAALIPDGYALGRVPLDDREYAFRAYAKRANKWLRVGKLNWRHLSRPMQNAAAWDWLDEHRVQP